jgi:hypothetical protein
MAKDKAHPEDLRETEPEPSDDLETADAKSGSVDERVPESLGVERAAAAGPAPAAFIPQAGIGVQPPLDDLGPGEAVLEKEREHLRIPKQRG